MKNQILFFLFCFTLSTQGHALNLRVESSFSQATNILEPGSFLFLTYYNSRGATENVLIVKKSAKNLNELEESEKNFLYLDFETVFAIYLNLMNTKKTLFYKDLLNKSVNYSEKYFWSFSKRSVFEEILIKPLLVFTHKYIVLPLEKFLESENEENQENENQQNENTQPSTEGKNIMHVMIFGAYMSYYFFTLRPNPKIHNSFINYLYRTLRLLSEFFLTSKINHLFTEGRLSHCSYHAHPLMRTLKAIFFINMTKALVYATEDIFFETLDQMLPSSYNKNNLLDAQEKTLQHSIHLNSTQPVILKVPDEVFTSLEKHSLY